MTLYVTGMAGVAVFHALVLGVGIWAAASRRRKNPQQGEIDMILANRELGLCLGILTLIATWVGGAYVNGAAEIMYSRGLAWCQAPIGYSLSLLFGALIFVRPMRKAKYVTMLDPFQEKYGTGIGGLLFIPALFGDVFWYGAILRILGNSLTVVSDVDPTISVCASALLIAIYTVYGGLYSVACTDALQLICIALGLSLALPYVALNPAVSLDKNLTTKDWLGEVRRQDIGEWVDGWLLLIFGGIPWQGYFQRILSIRNSEAVNRMSILSTLGCLVLAAPSAFMGIAARATNWSMIEGYNQTIMSENGHAVLPLVLRYLTPQWVSFIGLGAITSAVMSSADSSILASGSMFSRNIYKLVIRPKASDRELRWILTITICIISTLSVTLALKVDSVYYLSYLCSDLVYVVLFPQLLAVIHWPSLVDAYGCLAGYFVAVALRIAGGEKALGIPLLVEYPFYDQKNGMQKFPFRTTAMLAALMTQIVASFITRNLLGEGYLPGCCDVLGIYTSKKSKDRMGVVQSASGAPLMDSFAINKSTSGVDTCDRDTGYREHEIETNSSQRIFEKSCDNKFDDQYEMLRSSNCSGTIVSHDLSTLRNVSSCDANFNSKLTIPNNQYTATNNNPRSHQIIGVRNLRGSVGQTVLSSEIGPMSNSTSIVSTICPHPPPTGTSKISSGVNSSFTRVSTDGTKCDLKILNNEKSRDVKMMGGGDRSNIELNLNQIHNDGSGGIQLSCVKKNIKGVKLVGMEGGTLRGTSLQGTFSPTPSVEFVHILDRRQSSGSFGPGSLSPVPMTVEACKTHGTAAEGQAGNEHCRIKRGIVRHHSFNDTGDRALTTLARQPVYPSMPLRPEDCRMTLVQKENKRMTTINTIARHSSVMNEKELSGLTTGLVVRSPTYNMYASAIKTANYLITDDEAISRF